MSKIWRLKKTANERIVRSYAERSPVMTCGWTADGGVEWRTVVVFDTKSLVLDTEGEVQREGPVVLGIRYHERFLTEAPNPFEIATILRPQGIFHPNADGSAICLGHPDAGFSLETVLNQLWAGLMFNMKMVNTKPGDIVNRQAAEYVRSNVQLFPITKKGLFENPDEDLRNAHWFSRFDPKSHKIDGPPGDGEEDNENIQQK